MRQYARLLRYARAYRGSWIAIAVLTIVVAGLVALQPWPMKLLVDHVLGEVPVPGWLQAGMGVFSTEVSTQSVLIVVVIGGLAIFVLSSGFDAALTWLWTVTGRRMVYRLAEDLFARLQRCSLTFHKRRSVADLMSRVTVDSWSSYQLTEALVFSPGHALLTIAAMVFLMSRLDVNLTLLTLAIAPAMVGASFLLGKPLRAAARTKREVEARIQAHIQQTLTGIPVVQAFAQQEQESRRFQSFADAVIRSQKRSALLGSVNSLTSGLVTTIGFGVVLWLGARNVLEGRISLGSMLVFLGYLGALQAQIKVLAGTYTALQGLSASTHRVVEIMDAAQEITDAPDAKSLTAVRGEIQVLNVTAGYQSGSPVLKDVSFAASPSQTVAIVGHTGAGKTTLVNLVPRFMDPWQGRVLVDGHDLRGVRLETLRAQIGLVLQESFLFPLSIADNIAYGRPGATREEIETAARHANAHEFIKDLPQRYDTVIGERGATLSGGQRQRLAIARALLKNPPILILDEPTSALDAETERLVLEALHRLMEGRTTLVIAHRLSTVRRADQILVMKEGQIVETGSHSELLARGGHYARLHWIQSRNQNGREPRASETAITSAQ